MNFSDSEQDRWQRVPQGTLARIARGQADRRSVRRRVQIAAVSTCALLLLVGVGFGVRSLNVDRAPGPAFQENFFGGIGCRDVGRMLPAFAGGTLPAEDALKVQEHLEHCTWCAERMRQMQVEATPRSAGPIRGTPAVTGALLYADIRE